MTEGRKDTILLPSGAWARLAVQFAVGESNRWPYLYQSQLVRHDERMAGQFLVTAPGDRPAPEIGTGLENAG